MDLVQSKNGFLEGFYIVKVIWPSNSRGNLAIIGLSSKQYSMERSHSLPFCGNDGINFGWDISNNKGYCCNLPPFDYPNVQTDGFESVPDEFFMILDLKDGCLSFIANEKCLGIFPTDLRKCTLENEKLYITVCMSAPKSKVYIENVIVSADSLVTIMNFFKIRE